MGSIKFEKYKYDKYYRDNEYVKNDNKKFYIKIFLFLLIPIFVFFVFSFIFFTIFTLIKIFDGEIKITLMQFIWYVIVFYITFLIGIKIRNYGE